MLISFDTNQFMPLIQVDEIQEIHLINHKIQLKSRSIRGDLIISMNDDRILSCRNGRIVHEISTNDLMKTIYPFRTIDDEEFFLFHNENVELVEIFRFDSDGILSRHEQNQEMASTIFLDDFLQIGWKQILFVKNSSNLNEFSLTDFGQIHVFRQSIDDSIRVFRQETSFPRTELRRKSTPRRKVQALSCCE